MQPVFSNSMDTLNDTLYYALQGLETQLAMQYNCHPGWSCRQIVRTGIEVAQTMLGDEDVEDHKESYYTLISRRMCSEPRETMMVIIVMRVLFGLIENDSQARRCRSTFADDWCDEIEDIYYSYRQAVDEQIDIELTRQPNQTFTVTVMKTEQPQPVIKVFGNYIAEQKIDIDIHDNQNVYLGGACQPEMAEDVEPEQEEAKPAHKSPKDIWGVPQKGKYNQVREYIKDRKKGDPQFKEFCQGHSLREICSYLTDEFGWFVDEHSLGASINRHRN